MTDSINRRNFLLAGAASTVLCDGISPLLAQSNSLVVGHWGGAGAKIVRSAILPRMEKQAPGARIFLREGGDLDRKAMLEANPNNPEIDVYYFSGLDAKQLAERGLVDMPDAKLVPEFNNLYEVARDGAYGTYLHALTLLTAPDKAQPTSWFDLWRPEFKGRVCIPNTKTITNQAFLAAIIRAMGGNEKNPKDIADTKKKILELKPNIAVYHTGTSQALTVMKSGDAWLGVGLAGYTYQAKDMGQAVDVVFPKEGAVAQLDAVAVAKNSPNKELAYKYVNLAMSHPVQKSFAEDLYWGPTNSKVQVSDKAKSRIVYGPESIAKLINPDWPAILAIRADWIDWWDKNMT